MSTAVELDQASERGLPEALARALRHEVGDLLQTIYAAVAILQKRLPADAALERRVLADLRSRAVECKGLLDKISDLVSPLNLAIEPVDLTQLVDSLVTAIAPRYSNVEVRVVPSSPVSVSADEKRLAQIGEVLLTYACESARRQVTIHTGVDGVHGEVQWSVAADGPGLATQNVEELFAPLEMNRHANPGIGLALVQRLVLLHGGRIAAENLPEGGFRIQLWLPNKAAERS